MTSGCVRQCFNWPCPDMSCFPCLTGFTVEQFESFLCRANEIFHDASNNQFPGCECYARLRPCVPCQCSSVCVCDPCSLDRIDLCSGVGFPILQIVGVNVEGEPIDFDDWQLRDNRYLVKPSKGWPLQVRAAMDGDECTWSIDVRYGRDVPKMLLWWRDQWLFNELAKCLPDSGIKCDPWLVDAVNVKGVSYSKKLGLSPLEAVEKKYGCASECVGYIVDPDDFLHTSATVDRVDYIFDGDDSSSFCDVENLLADWVESQESNIKRVPLMSSGLDKHGLPL